MTGLISYDTIFQILWIGKDVLTISYHVDQESWHGVLAVSILPYKTYRNFPGLGRGSGSGLRSPGLSAFFPFFLLLENILWHVVSPKISWENFKLWYFNSFLSRVKSLPEFLQCHYLTPFSFIQSRFKMAATGRIRVIQKIFWY